MLLQLRLIDGFVDISIAFKCAVNTRVLQLECLSFLT